MTLRISREKNTRENHELLPTVLCYSFPSEIFLNKVRIIILKLLVYVWILDCTPSFLISENIVLSSLKILITKTKCLSSVHTHSKMAASNVTARDFMSVPSTPQAGSAFSREQ